MNEKLATLLESYAIKSGNSAEKMWSQLLIQARLDAYTSAGFGMFLICVLVYLWRVYYKYTPVSYFDPDKPTLKLLAVFISVILGLLIFVCFYSSAMTLINPEAWAIKYLLGK